VRLVCISDTHSRHRHLLVGSETRLRSGPLPEVIPAGDVLIHAGDCTSSGTLSELQGVAQWMGDQSHRYKILIAGNHDACFEQDNQESRKICEDNGIIYLQGEATTIDGLKFYGFPWQPVFRSITSQLRTCMSVAIPWRGASTICLILKPIFVGTSMNLMVLLSGRKMV
jgi:hypothetical protein